ncbi:MAG: hypothetical protein AAF399_14235 [Bacteroidota bacterium]
MKRILLLLISLYLLALPMTFAGGGWPQPKGHGYFKLSQWWILSDRHFTDAGKIDPNVTSGLYNTSLYGEYGFTDRFTGIIYAPFFSRATFNNQVSATTAEILRPGGAINGIGDWDIGFKYGLRTGKPLVISATLTVGLPLGNPAGGEQGNLQTGDGEFNQLLQIDASHSFRVGKHNAYATVYAGFNHRTRGFSEEVRGGLEGGIGFLDGKLYAILRVYGILSLKNGTSADPINSTSLFANNSEHLTISPEVAYRWNDHWGISATAARPLTGRIIFAGNAFSIGLFHTW